MSLGTLPPGVCPRPVLALVSREAAPDVVLLDLNMPRCNGLEALPGLRDRLPQTKIVVLTTGRAEDERDRSLRAGADGFVVKPDSVFSLPDDVLRALEG